MAKHVREAWRATANARVITDRGKHLYFRSYVETSNSAGRIGAGIDVRGAGGYAIAPPSIHPSGSVYALANRSVFVLAEAPRWFVDLALPGNDLRDAEIIPQAWSGDPRVTGRAVEGIIRAAATARPGERNATIYWAARRMHERIAAGVIGAGLAHDLLAEAARLTGLPAREAYLTIKSGLTGRTPP